MYWVNALSTQPSLEAALREVVDHASAQLYALESQGVVRPVLAGLAPPRPDGISDRTSLTPDLAILFVSAAFASEYSRVLPLLTELLSAKVLVGCSGGGIIGEGLEIEQEPAISLTLARLPDVHLHAFYLSGEETPDLDGSPDVWTDLIGISAQTQPHFILLADGFNSGVTDLLRGLDFAYPQATKVGGLVSGGSQPRQNALFLNSQLYRSGLIGLALSGNIQVDSVVAQGCRPIGKLLRVSASDGNIIVGLDDRSPLPLLQEMVQELTPQDQHLIRQANALFIGLVTDEFKCDPQQGDFLVRMILGLDPRSGAIAIGDRIRPGQTVQFHVRDAQTSTDDLRWVLERYQIQHDYPPEGALLFACLGRGMGLYDAPNHDINLCQEILGDIPMGGFFCNGEIGPVGSTTFLHGFTSAIALFRANY